MNRRSAGDHFAADVAIIGGSLGGVAGAIAAADAGASVVLTASTDWVGGQVSSQGVSALDEHAYIEDFGGTPSYDTFRHRIRTYYQTEHGAPAKMPDGRPLNPGNAWVSRLCFEPRVGHRILRTMLDADRRRERIRIVPNCEPTSATIEAGEITSISVQAHAGHEHVITAGIFLDATEWGDLLPLVDAEYLTGAEAKSTTGEAHAGPHSRPEEIQSFTYCFAVEYRPGEDHTIEPPAGYEQFREDQPYTFDYVDHAGDMAHYRMFESGPDGERPFWTYRRLIDASILDNFAYDIALINWSGNDYYRTSPIDQPADERARITAEAKQLARGFLYWLQTDAPRDDGQDTGYPELKLRPDIMDTADGLSKQPYVRECRRIVPKTRIHEGDVAVASIRGARSRVFAESVGVGWYGMDLHSCVGNPAKALHEPTRPYQLPAGALLPADGPTNLLASCKNIGTTHLTNGAYRLHPTEWAIGEAAGTIAGRASCCDRTPISLYEDVRQLRQLQFALVSRGVPIAWTVDIDSEHQLFDVTQLLYTWGAIPAGTPRHQRLEVDETAPITCGELHGVVSTAVSLLDRTTTIPVSTNPTQQADASLAGRTLTAAGFTADGISNPPTWQSVTRVLAPAIRTYLRSE